MYVHPDKGHLTSILKRESNVTLQLRGLFQTRQGLVVGLLMTAILAPQLGTVNPVTASGTRDVRAWITIASTSPGIGCSVDVSVEVLGEGEAVSGLSVAIAFFNDGASLASSDEAVTDSDGIAYLAFDTSSARDGDNGWLDINLAGTYAGGKDIAPRSNGDCASGGTLIALETTISTDQAKVSETAGDAVLIDGIPEYQQARSLSCEYASIQIATMSFGDPIWEDDSFAEIGQDDNPHLGFRGDIDGPWGITDDYGIYAEALVPHIQLHGYIAEVSYSADAGYLQAQLDAGHPTLVWFATRGDTSFYETDANGNSFKLVPYEHVVVVYGYDNGGVYISDPGNGAYGYLSWSWFLDAWSVLDGMALSIYPA